MPSYAILFHGNHNIKGSVDNLVPLTSVVSFLFVIVLGVGIEKIRLGIEDETI